MKVFISGSRSIKKLPIPALISLNKIIEQNMAILVGDASGVDSLVQAYCSRFNFKPIFKTDRKG